LRVYLDVSCLNRPFDDQSQTRIRLEAEAVLLILGKVDLEVWTQVSSEIALIEVDAISDSDRRAKVRLLLPEEQEIPRLTELIIKRAEVLERLGFKPADALHVAAAEESNADMLLSCDDRMCRLANRRRGQLRVPVRNPLDWLKEIGDAANA
jgi:predicted nucleic acid-binding protein